MEVEQLRELLRLVEERSAQHDKSKKDVQKQLQELCASVLEESVILREKIDEEIRESFYPLETQILELIEKLTDWKNKSKEEFSALIKQAEEVLSLEQNYSLQVTESEGSIIGSYSLCVTSERVAKRRVFESGSRDDGKEDMDTVAGTILYRLQDRLFRVKFYINDVNRKMDEVFANKEKEVSVLEGINAELESFYGKEAARLQEAVKAIREGLCSESPANMKELATKARAALFVSQKYAFRKPGKGGSLTDYKLVVTKGTSLRHIGFEEKKPMNVVASPTDGCEVMLSFVLFSADEVEILRQSGLSFSAVVSVWEKGRGEVGAARTFRTKYAPWSSDPIRFDAVLAGDTTYYLKVKVESSGMCTKWSDGAEFTTTEFSKCTWMKYPDTNGNHFGKKYVIDAVNPRIVAISKAYNSRASIVGNKAIPIGKTTSWHIKLLRLSKEKFTSVSVGVMPYKDEQKWTEWNYGWYLNLKKSMLWFRGPNEFWEGKDYGPRREDGQYVHPGDSVGVAMDTARGDLSFTLHGTNLGVAFEGIPLDNPLVPCVLLGKSDDIAEFDPTEVRVTEASREIAVPTKITAKSITWDSITLTWDAVEGASLYQIEVDGSKFWGGSFTNTFTKGGFFGDSEHTFRVRTVRGKIMSEWSEAVICRTQKTELEKCVWKRCPQTIDPKKKYTVNMKNQRIVTKNGEDNVYIGDPFETGECAIVGSVPIPVGKVSSWDIKVLKPGWSDGFGIYVGVAPFDIDPKESNNCESCGWYLNCYESSLRSGPPHNYNRKDYGPRKKQGMYVKAKDTVGVVMDMAKGELSFALYGVNLGVAYAGIPLDKPLVPCVLLLDKDDSIEFVPTAVKENVVEGGIPVPANVTARSWATWDTVELSWDPVADASFYQIEVDGTRSWESATTNKIIKRDLTADTEHSFRVRAVREKKLSEWSVAVQERTRKMTFDACGWKECPSDVEEKYRYFIDNDNPRASTRRDFIEHYIHRYPYTLVGNVTIPPNKVTSWSIRALESLSSGSEIYVGVAPVDINQDVDKNYNECGWYLDCYLSRLHSGPPHMYCEKDYGPRKKPGEYLLVRETVGVVMDMTKVELSYVLGGVNLGVAYRNIPLDKPLVPCVVVNFGGFKTELVI